MKPKTYQEADRRRERTAAAAEASLLFGPVVVWPALSACKSTTAVKTNYIKIKHMALLRAVINCQNHVL